MGSFRNGHPLWHKWVCPRIQVRLVFAGCAGASNRGRLAALGLVGEMHLLWFPCIGSQNWVRSVFPGCVGEDKAESGCSTVEFNHTASRSSHMSTRFHCGRRVSKSPRAAVGKMELKLRGRKEIKIFRVLVTDVHRQMKTLRASAGSPREPAAGRQFRTARVRGGVCAPLMLAITV